MQDDFNDVKEDMQEGCGAHGKLIMATRQAHFLCIFLVTLISFNFFEVAIVKPEHAKGNATLKPGKKL